MTREEHLKWAKERAAEYLDKDEWAEGWMSFVSDMNKHDELRDHIALELGMQLLVAGHNRSAREMRQFIEGFN